MTNNQNSKKKKEILSDIFFCQGFSFLGQSYCNKSLFEKINNHIPLS